MRGAAPGPGGPGRGPGGRSSGAMMNRMYAEKPKNMGKTIGRLIKYIGKNKFLVIGLVAVMIVITLLNLAGPKLIGEAIDAIGTGKGDFDGRRLITILVIMGALYLTTSIMTYFQGSSAAKLSQNTVFSLRTDLFAKITRLPLKFLDTHKHGDIMSRMTNDVENVSNAISQSLASLVSGVITLVGSLIMMLSLSPILTLVAMITIPLTLLGSFSMSKLMRKYFIRQQRLLGMLNSNIEETVTGYRTIVAYGREGKAIDEFGEVNNELRKTGIMANCFGSIMGPMMNVIGNLGFLCVCVAGGWLALDNAISIGVIASFIQYSKQFTRPINEIASQYTTLITAVAGAERVFEVLDADDEFASEKPDAKQLDEVVGRLDFTNVNFAYKEGEPVLRDFNFYIKPGRKVAIVGRTGSGKTTIVNLLTRFYDIDSGSITLDGVDIRDIDKQSLRSEIAIVLQDTVLFSDTVAANIKYGRLDATDEEMKAAAEMANADVFIERLPDGYDTKLAESGSNLSQGQRQLLSIARAVLADPKILILDEATSSVDTRTEMQIQQAMIKLMEGRTSLIIAHRLSTIRDADVIIVLDEGHIVEEGNHEQLLAKKGKYYDLYMTQFSGIAT
ncbi:MAG: ABC transporter ATP-binding protein [Clostridia bacterium]|nr:ABC transporter ATP-binding protein [Clostridia bacterium]